MIYNKQVDEKYGKPDINATNAKSVYWDFFSIFNNMELGTLSAFCIQNFKHRFCTPSTYSDQSDS